MGQADVPEVELKMRSRARRSVFPLDTFRQCFRRLRRIILPLRRSRWPWLAHWSISSPVAFEGDIVVKLTDSGAPRLVLPLAFQLTALKEMHSSPIGGHLGVKKTLAKPRQRYF